MVSLPRLFSHIYCLGPRPQADQNSLQEVQEAHRSQGLAVQEG